MTQTQTALRVQCLPPIVSQESKVLILGSMPGKESLRANQYYAHPKNKFWDIMGELFGAGRALLYDERVNLLQSRGVALWDVLQECEREGSLDATITEEVANDFSKFFNKHPNITYVFFNGEKAESAFRRHALPSLTEERFLFERERLPSTSPANAMKLGVKVQAWCVVRNALSC